MIIKIFILQISFISLKCSAFPSLSIPSAWVPCFMERENEKYPDAASVSQSREGGQHINFNKHTQGIYYDKDMQINKIWCHSSTALIQ